MWPGACRCLSAYFRQCAPCWKRLRSFGVRACVSVLLLTVPGCSWISSTREQIPTLPVLQSLQRATLNGVQGVWMNDADAGNLALWLEEVAP